MKGRISKAIELARIEFWKTIAKELQEIESGDINPMEFEMFQRCTRRAVENWVESNKE